jgi:hypothetical protein
VLESPIKLMDIITDPSINDLIDPIFDTINPETGPIIDALIVSGSRIRAVSTACLLRLLINLQVKVFLQVLGSYTIRCKIRIPQ